MKPWLVLSAALVLMVACQPKPAAPPAAKVAVQPAASPSPPPVAPSAPFYVGRWAASPDRCQAQAWTITDHDLTTPEGVSCHFDSPPSGEGPVEIDASCMTQGPASRTLLRFSHAQSAGALMVENGPFADAGLVGCVEETPPPDRTPVSEAPFTPTSAQGAADVVQSYFALVEEKQFDKAWRLWAGGGQAGAPSAQAFAARFADYAEYHGQVGGPGRIEGAAGSLYIEVPIQAYGRLKDGREFRASGTATLKRINDVPGSTAEQRLWRISAITLQPPA